MLQQERKSASERSKVNERLLVTSEVPRPPGKTRESEPLNADVFAAEMLDTLVEAGGVTWYGKVRDGVIAASGDSVRVIVGNKSEPLPVRFSNEAQARAFATSLADSVGRMHAERIGLPQMSAAEFTDAEEARKYALAHSYIDWEGNATVLGEEFGGKELGHAMLLQRARCKAPNLDYDHYSEGRARQAFDDPKEDAAWRSDLNSRVNAEKRRAGSGPRAQKAVPTEKRVEPKKGLFARIFGGLFRD